MQSEYITFLWEMYVRKSVNLLPCANSLPPIPCDRLGHRRLNLKCKAIDLACSSPNNPARPCLNICHFCCYGPDRCCSNYRRYYCRKAHSLAMQMAQHQNLCYTGAGQLLQRRSAAYFYGSCHVHSAR